MDTFENSVQCNCVDNMTLNYLISIFTFLMSSMVMYRSNSDHNVVCHDIWFRIKHNLGHF